MAILKIWNGSEWGEISAILGEHVNLTGLSDDDRNHGHKGDRPWPWDLSKCPMISGNWLLS